MFGLSYSLRKASKGFLLDLQRKFEVSQEHESAIFEKLEFERHLKSTKMVAHFCAQKKGCKPDGLQAFDNMYEAY